MKIRNFVMLNAVLCAGGKYQVIYQGQGYRANSKQAIIDMIEKPVTAQPGTDKKNADPGPKS